MSSEPEFAVSCVRWRDAKSAPPRQHAVAIMDTAQMLRDGIPIFAIDRPNEFVAKFIPSPYIKEVLPMP